jgi:FMN reductase
LRTVGRQAASFALAFGAHDSDAYHAVERETSIVQG